MTRHEESLARQYRLTRIVGLAKYSLGKDHAANRWLKHPNAALGGRTPIELMDTEPGVRTRSGECPWPHRLRWN